MKSKILVIPGWYPNHLNKWEGDFVLNQTKLLRQEGLRMDLCFADLNWRYLKSGNIFAERYMFVDHQGNHDWIISGPFWPKNQSFGLEAWISVFASFVLQTMDSKETPEIILAHTYLGGSIAQRIKKKTGIPYVVMEHSSLLMSDRLPRPHREKVEKAYSDSDAVVAVSPALARAIEKLYGFKCLMTPNFIDTNLFQAQSVKSDQFTFIMVADLIPRKQVDLLIAAFANMNRNSNCKLKIAGDGSEKNKIKSLIVRNGLGTSVELLGQLNQIEVAKLMGNSHALVHSAQLETFGLVLVEAMSCGLPVICFKNGGSDHLIDEQNGILVDQGNVEKLAEAMERVMKNYSRYDIEKIRLKALDEFSPTTARSRWQAVFKKLGTVPSSGTD